MFGIWTATAIKRLRPVPAFRLTLLARPGIIAPLRPTRSSRAALIVLSQQTALPVARRDNTVFANTLRMLLLLLLTAFASKVAMMILSPHQSSLLFSAEGARALAWGLRLDLTAAAALTTLLVLLMLAGRRWGPSPRWLRPPLLLAGGWLVLTTTADAIYQLEAGRHVTFEVFTGQGLEGGLVATALTGYAAHSLTALGLLLALTLAVYRLPLSRPDAAGRRWHRDGAFLLAWLLFAVSAIRGGWSDAPQSPMSAYKIGNLELAAVAWSAPYAISYYLAKGSKRAAQQQTAEPTAADLARLADYHDTTSPWQPPARRANVLMVLLESWTAADLLSYGGQVDAAPHFDRLRARSFSTRAMYADGYRTVEGMFATFCSFPNPVGGGVAGTQLQGADYRCLPRLLKEQGWDTRFIQGSGKGIVGAFAQSLGFTHSYGKTDYGFDGTENYWGYMDDDIYRFTLDRLRGLSGPWFVTVNTGTTHDTYLPDEADYVFGKADRTALRRNVVHHADAALQRFIERLPEVLSEPTLVVLVADHTSGSAPVGLERNAIPFLMYATDGSLPTKHSPARAGQLDVAPSILDWLGGHAPWFTGRSLLRDPDQGFAHYSRGRTVSWIEGQRLLRFDVTTAQGADCFQVAENGLDISPAACTEADRPREHRARAYTRYTQSLLFKGKTGHFAQGLTGDDDGQTARLGTSAPAP